MGCGTIFVRRMPWPQIQIGVPAEFGSNTCSINAIYAPQIWTPLNKSKISVWFLKFTAAQEIDSCYLSLRRTALLRVLPPSLSWVGYCLIRSLAVHKSRSLFSSLPQIPLINALGHSVCGGSSSNLSFAASVAMRMFASACVKWRPNASSS